jgi:hypothetical protein
VSGTQVIPKNDQPMPAGTPGLADFLMDVVLLAICDSNRYG